MTTAWTNQNKPSGTTYSNVQKPSPTTSVISMASGDPIGLLLALTYSTSSTVLNPIWTKQSNASGTGWTNVPKAT